VSQAVGRKHKKRAQPLSARALYTERNRLVAALSGLFPAHLMLDPAADEPWATLVCIHLPAGAATWHIPPWDLSFFAHLAYAPLHWDGHTTEEKYERLQALTGAAAPAGTSSDRLRPCWNKNRPTTEPAGQESDGDIEHSNGLGREFQ